MATPRKLKLRPAYEVDVDMSEWNLPKMEEAMKMPIQTLVEKAVSTGLEEALQWMVEEDCCAFFLAGEDDKSIDLSVGFNALDARRELWYHIDIADLTKKYCSDLDESERYEAEILAATLLTCLDMVNRKLSEMSK